MFLLSEVPASMPLILPTILGLGRWPLPEESLARDEFSGLDASSVMGEEKGSLSCLGGRKLAADFVSIVRFMGMFLRRSLFRNLLVMFGFAGAMILYALRNVGVPCA